VPDANARTPVRRADADTLRSITERRNDDRPACAQGRLICAQQGGGTSASRFLADREPRQNVVVFCAAFFLPIHIV